MVYAKNRASVTLDGKTWRMEYQPTNTGFRYMDTANEWTGRDDLRPCANGAAAAARSPSIAGRCGGRRESYCFSQNLIA